MHGPSTLLDNKFEKILDSLDHMHFFFFFLFIATYIIRLQLDSVSKDVGCEVGFLEDFIKLSFILGNIHTHTHTHLGVKTKFGGHLKKKAVHYI